MVLPQKGIQISSAVCASVAEALAAVRAREGLDCGADVLVTGSLYVVGEAMAASGVSAT